MQASACRAAPRATVEWSAKKVAGQSAREPPGRRGSQRSRRSPRTLDRNGPGEVYSALSRALIGDPRNDENVIVSQLQAAMLRCRSGTTPWFGVIYRFEAPMYAGAGEVVRPAGFLERRRSAPPFGIEACSPQGGLDGG